jgi:hypothetical protein
MKLFCVKILLHMFCNMFEYFTSSIISIFKGDMNLDINITINEFTNFKFIHFNFIFPFQDL